jgi:hypothetical protein
MLGPVASEVVLSVVTGADATTSWARAEPDHAVSAAVASVRSAVAASVERFMMNSFGSW